MKIEIKGITLEPGVAPILEKVYEAHDGQFLHDKVTPYFNHITDTIRRFTLRNWAWQPFEIRNGQNVAALHDILEDTPITIMGLREWSIPDSSKVIEAVKLMTKDRYDDYIEYIRMIKDNKYARAVKIADMLSNLSGLGGEPSDKQIIKYTKGLRILLGEEA